MPKRRECFLAIVGLIFWSDLNIKKKIWIGLRKKGVFDDNKTYLNLWLSKKRYFSIIDTLECKWLFSIEILLSIDQTCVFDIIRLDKIEVHFSYELLHKVLDFKRSLFVIELFLTEFHELNNARLVDAISTWNIFDGDFIFAKDKSSKISIQKIYGLFEGNLHKTVLYAEVFDSLESTVSELL